MANITSNLYGISSNANTASVWLTGSLLGTSSFAVSSSNAFTASYGFSGSYATSASYALSSSYGLSSSYALSASTAFTSSYAASSSWLDSLSHAGNTLFDTVTSQSTYVLTQSFDQNRVLTFITNSIVTLPNAFPVGWSCLVMQSGSGQVTFTQSLNGRLVNRQNFTKTAGQYAVVSLLCFATSSANSSSWVLGGDGA